MYACVRTNVASSRGSGVNGNNHSSLEPESKCCGSVLYFDFTTWVGMVVGV